MSPGPTADSVLGEAARRAGLAPAPARLIRAGSHTLFVLPGHVVARVGPAGSAERSRREVNVAIWLERSGVPAVRPLAGPAQPTLVGDRPVTWWHEISQHRPATPGELGAVLRALHGLPPPGALALPPLDPFDGLDERIDRARWLATADRTWLAGHLDDLRRRGADLPASRPACVVHGDAWQGNVAVPRRGPALLLDLERVAIGPPEWDLLPIAADRTDFGRIGPDAYRSFVAAYGGHDVTIWPGYRTMVDVMELRWVCFALDRGAADRAAAVQARHRVACLRGEVPRPWRWEAL